MADGDPISRSFRSPPDPRQEGRCDHKLMTSIVIKAMREWFAYADQV